MFPKREFYKSSHVPTYELKDDCSNASDFAKVDVLGNKPLCVNYGGWSRSDLAVINAQTDIKIAQSMAHNLVELPESGMVDKTDAEIMLLAKSKYLQSNSEQARWIESQINFRDEQLIKRAELQQKQSDAVRAEQERQAIKDSLTPEEREEIRVAKRKKQTSKLI